MAVNYPEHQDLAFRVLISGPTSSGKTTLINRFNPQLLENGGLRIQFAGEGFTCTFDCEESDDISSVQADESRHGVILVFDGTKANKALDYWVSKAYILLGGSSIGKAVVVAYTMEDIKTKKAIARSDAGEDASFEISNVSGLNTSKPFSAVAKKVTGRTFRFE